MALLPVPITTQTDVYIGSFDSNIEKYEVDIKSRLRNLIHHINLYPVSQFAYYWGVFKGMAPKVLSIDYIKWRFDFRPVAPCSELDAARLLRAELTRRQSTYLENEGDVELDQLFKQALDLLTDRIHGILGWCK